MLPRKSQRQAFVAIAVLAMTVRSAGSAGGQEPTPGTVQKLPVISLDLQAGSTEKQTKRVTYTPPPGWYIRSHSVHCTHRQGHTSYVVSTVPAGWNLASENRQTDTDRQLFDVAALVHELGGQGRLRSEQHSAAYASRSASSSHHALIVDATAVGEGMFRGSSEIELTVIAELVYVGTELVELPRFGPIPGSKTGLDVAGSEQPIGGRR
jgi:hypothetical protein